MIYGFLLTFFIWSISVQRFCGFLEVLEKGVDDGESNGLAEGSAKRPAGLTVGGSQRDRKRVISVLQGSARRILDAKTAKARFIDFIKETTPLQGRFVS